MDRMPRDIRLALQRGGEFTPEHSIRFLRWLDKSDSNDAWIRNMKNATMHDVFTAEVLSKLADCTVDRIGAQPCKA